MAHIYRLILRSLLPILLLCTQGAYAAATCPLYRATGPLGDTGWKLTPAAVCSAASGAAPPQAGFVSDTYSFFAQSDAKCGGSRTYVMTDGYTSTSSASLTIFLGSGSGAQCEPPNRDKEKACGYDFQYAGWGVGHGKYSDAWALDGKVASGLKCDAHTDAQPGGTGCQVKFTASGYTKNDDGSWTTIGKFTAVSGANPGEGVPCSPAYEGEGKEVVADKPKECAGYKGTVNGVDKCIANTQNNGVEFAKTEKTEKKNDGTTVETKVEQKCEGDKCTTTTTTTTKNASGQVTGVDMNTKTQDKAGFCKENADKCDGKGNPGVAGGTGSKNGTGGEDDEEEKGKFGGSCEAGFTCEGDAIQCAIAKKQHMTACTLEDSQNEFYQLFNQNKNKTGNVTEGLPGNKSENILSRISGIGDDFLGSGAACPADRTISFGFGEVTIPYSTLCPYLELMGRILVVLAALSGASIIIKRES